MDEQSINVEGLMNEASHFAEQGKTFMYMSINGKEAEFFGIADKQGLKLKMLLSA